jgi:hypothetical protein
MSENQRTPSPIDEMVSKAHRESQAEPTTVKVAAHLVFTVPAARRKELDDAYDGAKHRLFPDE